MGDDAYFGLGLLVVKSPFLVIVFCLIWFGSCCLFCVCVCV